MKKNYIKIGDEFIVVGPFGQTTARFIDFEVPTIQLATGEVYSGQFKKTDTTAWLYVPELQNNIQLFGNFKWYQVSYDDQIWGDKRPNGIINNTYYLSKKLAQQDFDAFVRFYGRLADDQVFFYKPIYEGDKLQGFYFEKRVNGETLRHTAVGMFSYNRK